MSDTINIVHPVHGKAVVGVEQWNSSDDHGWAEKDARASGWVPADEAEDEATDETGGGSDTSGKPAKKPKKKA